MFIAGCSAPPLQTTPLEFQRADQTRREGLLGSAPAALPTETPIVATPKVPPMIDGNMRNTAPTPVGQGEVGNISVSLEQMPLPSFIAAVYGGILKLNYSVDTAVAARTELITFRTPRPLTAAKLAELSNILLKSYGITVQDFGGVLRMVPATATSAILPEIRRGRAQPTVPQSLRPIFQYIEFEAIRAQSVLPSLKRMLGDRVQLQEDNFNGLLISGQSDAVQTALELIQVFDQPSMKGQRSLRITPRFWGAEEFARRLTEILRAEGYAAANQVDSTAPIIVLPMPSINGVIAFAQTDAILEHLQSWARELDQLSQVQQGGSMFTYPVKNADASDLAKSLNELIGGGGGGGAAPTGAAGATAAAGAPGTAGGQASRSTRRGVVVNNATNTLIFQGGTQDEYRQWLGLLTELDKPVRSALIDVVVAEVSLNDTNNLGFAWQLDQLSSQSGVRLTRTVYNTGVSGSGLTINALLGGNPLRTLAINALASNTASRVISSPKVMTRNGETATISVGQDVPIVSSQAVSPSQSIIGGSSTVVPQSVQYRNTGTILTVKPVIHAGDRIDLDITQEVSSAIPTTTGVTTSPTISNRRIDTKLSLRDGATVMLGGLIGETNTASDSGVPLLKDIPVLGSVFKSSTKSSDRIELIVLITPYIISDSFDAENATNAFQGSMSEWMRKVRPRVGPRPPSGVNQPDDGAIEAAPVAGAVPAKRAAMSGANATSPVAGSTREAGGQRMINLSNAQPGAASTDAMPSGASAVAPVVAPSDALPPTGPAGSAMTPAARAPANLPATVNGFRVPQGARAVEGDEAQQILKSLGR